MRAEDELFAHMKGYYVTKTLLALWRTGLLERASGGGLLDINRLAEAEGYSPELLQALLDYLTTQGYFEHHADGVFRLSDKGSLASPYFGYLSMLVGAYEPVSSQLEDVLIGRVVYGQHVTRSERELFRALTALEERLPSQLTQLVDTSQFSRVLDLGCGSAKTLSRICKLSNHIRGVGVDWDPVACEEAERTIKQEGLQDRVTIVRGNAGRIRDLAPGSTEGVDLVLAMFVLHEVLRQQGRAGTVDCLRSIASLLPSHGRLVMVEVSRNAAQQAEETLLFIPEYSLVHDFSDQQLASREEWEALLGEAGMRVVSAGPANMCRAFCLVAVPV